VLTISQNRVTVRLKSYFTIINKEWNQNSICFKAKNTLLVLDLLVVPGNWQKTISKLFQFSCIDLNLWPQAFNEILYSLTKHLVDTNLFKVDGESQNDGRGIVQGGKKTGRELSGVEKRQEGELTGMAKMTGGEFSGRGNVLIPFYMYYTLNYSFQMESI